MAKRAVMACAALAAVLVPLGASRGPSATEGVALGMLAGDIDAPKYAERTIDGSTSAPTPTTLPPATTTTVSMPDDPLETVVATAKSQITELATFEMPDGEPVAFELPITNPTFFENDLVLMVTDVSGDGRWLQVQIPVRPNGTEAWIRSADVTLSTHRFHALINLTERSVTVWNGDEVVVQTEAVVGKDGTPTPLGQFFVNDLVEKWDASAYGPYILSLSGFSEALDTFGGGLPVIAIHGTNRPELMGGAHSNGCIRIPNEVVRVLADTVPMGTPVDIVA